MFDEGNAFKWELVLGKGSGFMNGLCKIVRDWRSLEKFFATMKISLTITLYVSKDSSSRQRFSAHPYIDPSRHVVHRLARKPSKSIMANFSDLD